MAGINTLVNATTRKAASSKTGTAMNTLYNTFVSAKNGIDSAHEATADVMGKQNGRLEEIRLLTRLADSQDKMEETLKELLDVETKKNGAGSLLGGLGMLIPLLGGMAAFFKPELMKELTTAIKALNTGSHVATAAADVAKAKKLLDAAGAAKSIGDVAKATGATADASKIVGDVSKVGVLKQFLAGQHKRAGLSMSAIGYGGALGRYAAGDDVGAGLDATSTALGHSKSVKAKLFALGLDGVSIGRDIFRHVTGADKDDGKNMLNAVKRTTGFGPGDDASNNALSPDASKSSEVVNPIAVGAAAGGGLLASRGIIKGAKALRAGLTPAASAASAATNATRVAGVEAAEKIAVKGSAKMLGKLVPGLALAFAAQGAYSRAKDGDILGAGLEVISGITATIPGLGTAASVAIQAGLIARDVNKELTKSTETSIAGVDDLHKSATDSMTATAATSAQLATTMKDGTSDLFDHMKKSTDEIFSSIGNFFKNMPLPKWLGGSGDSGASYTDASKDPLLRDNKKIKAGEKYNAFGEGTSWTHDTGNRIRQLFGDDDVIKPKEGELPPRMAIAAANNSLSTAPTKGGSGAGGGGPTSIVSSDKKPAEKSWWQSDKGLYGLLTNGTVVGDATTDKDVADKKAQKDANIKANNDTKSGSIVATQPPANQSTASASASASAPIPQKSKDSDGSIKKNDTTDRQKEIGGYLADGAKKFDVDEGYLRGTIRMEGGMRGARSSTGATGVGQFTMGTWNDLIDNRDKEIAAGAKSIGMKRVTSTNKGTDADPRNDAKVNAMATALLAKSNAKELKRNGVEATSENLYMAHNVGATTAANAIKGKGEISRHAMDVNGGAGMDTQQFLRMQKAKFNNNYDAANGINGGSGSLEGKSNNIKTKDMSPSVTASNTADKAAADEKSGSIAQFIAKYANPSQSDVAESLSSFFKNPAESAYVKHTRMQYGDAIKPASEFRGTYTPDEMSKYGMAGKTASFKLGVGKPNFTRDRYADDTSTQYQPDIQKSKIESDGIDPLNDTRPVNGGAGIDPLNDTRSIADASGIDPLNDTRPVNGVQPSIQLHPDLTEGNNVSKIIEYHNQQQNKMQNAPPNVQVNIPPATPVETKSLQSGTASNASGLNAPMIVRNPDSIIREVSIMMLKSSV